MAFGFYYDFPQIGIETNQLNRNVGTSGINGATEFRLRLDDSASPIKVSVKESGRGSW